jgi:anti-anti-sigma regulatory factor
MTLTLPSALTVVEVTKFRGELLAALDAGGDLELDARALEDVDVAGLQLLEATFKSAASRGLALRFTAGGRGAIDATAASAGLRLAADPSRWREANHA